MPWKIIDLKQARRHFVAARWESQESMSALCRRFGISRQCGYEWWRRAQQGTLLAQRSHHTRRAQALFARWGPRVRSLHRRYRYAGAAQLHWYLQRAYPMGPWPAIRTIGRWLAREGLSVRRRRRAVAGPVVRQAAIKPCAPNDVWTMDFKGWFRTKDGRKVCALTVRDLATRYVLHVGHLTRTTEPVVAAVVRRLFKRYGLPRAVQINNGPPFGGHGPYGWSTLTAGWVRLGIHIRYGRPACPQDNGAHEQMHRMLKQQATRPASANLPAQQRRLARWRTYYNHDRPHQALRMQVPAAFYQCSARRPVPPAWHSPPGCSYRKTDPRGRIRWAGRARLIGQAFARQTIALLPLKPGVVQVYFGPHLLGELCATDTTAIRAVQVHQAKTRFSKGREPSPLP